MPSCKISWWKNVNENGKKSLYLIYNIVSLDNLENLFREDKLNMNLLSNI